MKLYQEQIHYGLGIIDLVRVFFTDFRLEADAKVFVDNDVHKKVIATFGEKIASCNVLSDDVIKELINVAKEECGVKGKDLFMPIRIGVSGSMHGPDLVTLIRLLGKDKVLNNIKAVVA
jgi:nondiscriminating glutamyl-tRNA synthetase